MSIGRAITKGIEKIFSVAKRRGLEEEEKRQLFIENITKELSKFSNEDLEKIAMLAETARAIQKKDARAVTEFISKKENLEKVTSLAKTTKDFKEKDVKAISKFVNKISKENLEKIADIAGIVKVIQAKDARAIFDFINKAPKRKLEKIAILAGIASTIPEFKEIKIPSESVVKVIEFIKFQENLRRLEELERLSEQRKILPPDEIKRIRKEIEKMGLFGGTARLASELEDLKRRSIIHRGETHGGEREISEEIEIPFQKGVMLLKTGKYGEAYDVFNDIISENPNLKSAWLNKGVAAGGLGRTLEEIDCYKEALRRDRNYATALANLALAHESCGNIEEANGYFEKLKSGRR